MGNPLKYFAELRDLRVERNREVSGKIEREIRYYITSLRPDAARLNAVIRLHWGIENKLLWVLDVGFGEDLDRKRAGHSVQNFPYSTALHSMSLNRTRPQNAESKGNNSKQLGINPVC